MADGVKPRMTVRMDPAEMFLSTKSRLPRTFAEAVEWFHEFARFEEYQFKTLEDAYHAHLDTCHRPILMDAQLWTPLKAQAVREATLEEAALIARGHQDGDGFAKHGTRQLYWKGRSDAATEIRAKKEKP